ncbi:circularly permuted type 2 ATP-grasp protein [Nocardia uniformis]|uniref:Circularly permuted type 2 ATP-grasp protein n=2 Tax=Nocardia uniformis TaxID=53432 RepID=A0A849C3K5_9NOCA|nr:circularly permuted type 2 ATP-grasp protein [Nocardia uniformis]
MWTELSADFLDQGRAGLHQMDARVRRLISDDAITYTEVSGYPGERASEPTPWRLDPIPLLVSADDWTDLEAGLVQRSRLLNAVLTDVYGERRTLTAGLLPPQLVFGHRGYVRAAHGVSLPGRQQLFLHACDISRWSDGQFRVLNDWAQAPSGAGYALADRRVVAAAIPEAFELASPRPLTPFVRAMRLMLIEAAPRAGDSEPVVVVLSPGVHSETAFDQAYLASVLGFPLVESADLVVRDGRLWMRSLGTLERVDVVLRRVDAEFSDPLDLRPDSRLGVVGLVEVLRRGAVTVVNTLGSGLLESPALSSFLPRLSRTLLDEDLKLPGVPSYWGGDDLERAHLRTNVDRLILRSTVDDTTVFGPVLSQEQREEWCARIDAEGWRWVGQEPAQFSIAPAIAESGGLSAAPVAFRLFSLAGRVGYRVMPGGLGQLHQASGPAGLIAEAAAKDVWVHAAPTTVPAVTAELPDERERPAPTAAAHEVVSSPRVLNDLFWLGRYNERAESTVRLLAAIHDRYQDYRYRPWMEGAGGMIVLVSALARMTGTPYPPTKPPATQAPPASSSSPSKGGPEGERTQSPSGGPEGERTQSQAAGAGELAGPLGSSGQSRGGGTQSQSGGSKGERTQSQSVGAQGSRVPLEYRRRRGAFDHPTEPIALPGVSWRDHQFLVTLTIDRELPGSLAYAVDRYEKAARAVRDQLSADTWMTLGAMDRAFAEYRGAREDRVVALGGVHTRVLSGLLALSGIDSEIMVRDTGWHVMDIGRRIERALSLTALLAAAFTDTYPPGVSQVVTEAVLQATASAVSYRRRHRGSVRIAAVTELLLFDTANPRSLAYQLDRIEADLLALPGASGASRPQRLLTEAQRMVRRLDPADLEVIDDAGHRTELAELLDGVNLRLRQLSESFEATRLSVPSGIQPLWGSARVVS